MRQCGPTVALGAYNCLRFLENQVELYVQSSKVSKQIYALPSCHVTRPVEPMLARVWMFMVTTASRGNDMIAAHASLEYASPSSVPGSGTGKGGVLHASWDGGGRYISPEGRRETVIAGANPLTYRLLATVSLAWTLRRHLALSFLASRARQGGHSSYYMICSPQELRCLNARASSGTE